MPDPVNFTSLPEDGTYPAGVVRLENGWSPSGGAVDPANSGGILNWPLQQLAARTGWLKAAVTGLLARTVSGGGLATGGGNLSADRTITVPKATQAQAEAGTDDATAMTPLRVKQAVQALMASAASAAGFVLVTGPLGYVRWPAWLGGWILQWGVLNSQNNGTVTFPVAFPEAVWTVLTSDYGDTNYSVSPINVGLASMQLRMKDDAGLAVTTANQISFIAFGI